LYFANICHLVFGSVIKSEMSMQPDDLNYDQQQDEEVASGVVNTLAAIPTVATQLDHDLSTAANTSVLSGLSNEIHVINASVDVSIVHQSHENNEELQVHVGSEDGQQVRGGTRACSAKRKKPSDENVVSGQEDVPSMQLPTSLNMTTTGPISSVLTISDHPVSLLSLVHGHRMPALSTSATTHATVNGASVSIPDWVSSDPDQQRPSAIIFPNEESFFWGDKNQLGVRVLNVERSIEGNNSIHASMFDESRESVATDPLLNIAPSDPSGQTQRPLFANITPPEPILSNGSVVPIVDPYQLAARRIGDNLVVSDDRDAIAYGQGDAGDSKFTLKDELSDWD
jgi:hypothetical protein